MFNSETKIVSGPDHPVLFHPNASVGQILLYSLERTPDRVSQVCLEDGITLTCDELRTLSVRVALNLKKAGLKSGDIVGLVADNSTYTVPIMIGCFLLGYPLAILDPGFVLKEVDYVLKHVKPKIVFVDYNVVDNMKNILKEFNIDAEIVSLIQDRDDCLPLGNFIAEHEDEKTFM